MDSLKNKNFSIEKISNILTLRYYPNNQSKLKTVNWKDCLPKKTIDNILIKNLLQKSLKKNLDSKSNLAIALSGGVDSTLLLSLTKEIFPDLPITAITITFPYSEDESNSASNIAQYFDIDHKIIHVDNFLKELPQGEWGDIRLNVIDLPNYIKCGEWKNTKEQRNIMISYK